MGLLIIRLYINCNQNIFWGFFIFMSVPTLFFENQFNEFKSPPTPFGALQSQWHVRWPYNEWPHTNNINWNENKIDLRLCQKVLQTDKNCLLPRSSPSPFRGRDSPARESHSGKYLYSRRRLTINWLVLLPSVSGKWIS